jgi:hypothetical protein
MFMPLRRIRLELKIHTNPLFIFLTRTGQACFQEGEVGILAGRRSALRRWTLAHLVRSRLEVRTCKEYRMVFATVSSRKGVPWRSSTHACFYYRHSVRIVLLVALLSALRMASWRTVSPASTGNYFAHFLLTRFFVQTHLFMSSHNDVYSFSRVSLDPFSVSLPWLSTWTAPQAPMASSSTTRPT